MATSEMEKLLTLQSIVGTEKAQQLWQEAQKSEKEADDLGVSFKETKSTEKGKGKKPAFLANLEDDEDEDEDYEEEEVKPMPKKKKEAEVDTDILDSPLSDLSIGQFAGLMTELTASSTEKEAGAVTAVKAELAQVKADLAATLKEVKNLRVGMGELLGVQPKRGYRASEDNENVTEKETTEEVQADPVQSFFGGFIPKQQ